MAMLDDHEHKQPVHDFDGIIENRVNSPPVYFTVLFYGLIVWGVVFSAFYLLSGWSSEAEFHAKLQAHQAQYQAAAPPAAKPAAPVADPVAAPAPKAPEPVAAPAAVAAKAVDVDAQALYDGKCAMCHGADAKGGFGPDLTLPADKYEYGKSREALTVSIAQGRGKGKMPGFAGQLQESEIAALVDYLLALK